MAGHVEDIGNLGGIERQQAPGVFFQGLPVRGSQICRQEDAPVCSKGFMRHMEKNVRTFVIHIVADGPHQAKVPFRKPICELAHVDPPYGLAVGDYIADLEVAVEAGVGLRDGFDKTERTLLVILRYKVLLLLA